MKTQQTTSLAHRLAHQAKWLPLFMVTILFLSGCAYEERDQLKEMNAQLEMQLKQTDSTVNMLLETFNEVDANLALIKEKEGLINLDADNPEMNIEKRKKVVSDIHAINNLMEENRKKIAALQEDLKKSGLNVKQFQKKIKLLNTQLEEKAKDIERLTESLSAKDTQIAGLFSTVDTLSNQIAMQSSTIQQRDTAIHNMDKEMNTFYVKEGTYKELKELGLIDNNGWTPWTGKKVELNENLVKSKFTAIDKRETTSIPINAKKATVVSDHPENSYDFKKTSEGLIASLEIKDPDEFWKISKYLVVEVK